MEAKNIALCLLTWVLCQASRVAADDNISRAVGYVILANLVNLFQFSTVWNPELLKNFNNLRKIALTFMPFSLLILFTCLSSITMMLKKSALVAIGLHLIGLRSVFALRHFGRFLSPQTTALDEYFVLVTGLKLCEEINCKESEEVDDAVTQEGWEVIRKPE